MTDNNPEAITRIAIVGGGTAGWMTAAALSQLFADKPCRVTLVESEQIGTVGVGEATLPHLRFFNQRLGIDEPDFMQKVGATYKLGIEFANWGRIGDAYIHPFGDYGKALNGVPFHHYWLKARQAGDTTPIGDYSLPVVAAQRSRFDYPDPDHESILSTFSFAYHIDAGLYAKYLRAYSEQRGVVRCEGKITRVHQHDHTGFIQSVETDRGDVIDADLFIDCSGFRGLLIEQTLTTGYEHWSHWLPCDRAVAVPSSSDAAPIPYTKATADSAGWRWRIPLQHRTGNGHVYCSNFMSDDEALERLLAGLDGTAEADPNFLRFNTGRRKKMWNKNVVAIGLSAGFLEPLESTGIHLIQLGIMKLLEFFPDKNMNAAYSSEFNRMMQMEIERVKDFLILHYHATERTDSEFWNTVRTMTLPKELQRKMNLFKQTGQVVRYKEGLFLEPSWVAVYLGQGYLPEHIDPRLDGLSSADLTTKLTQLKHAINTAVTGMPSHVDAIKNLGAAGNDGWKHATMSLYGHE